MDMQGRPESLHMQLEHLTSENQSLYDEIERLHHLRFTGEQAASENQSLYDEIERLHHLHFTGGRAQAARLAELEGRQLSSSSARLCTRKRSTAT